MNSHRFFLLFVLVSVLLFLTTASRSLAVDNTITVNTIDDQFNTDISHCSLREAIQSANTDALSAGCIAGSGADRINLGSGTFDLTIPGYMEDLNATGDLDITSDVTIRGQGPANTIIDAHWNIDRVLDVHSGATVTLESLTIMRGHAPNVADTAEAHGGAIRNFGSLRLVDVHVESSLAGHGSGGSPNAATGGSGGCIYSEGPSLTLINSSIQGCFAGYGESGKPLGHGGGGGGILSYSTTTIIDSNISDNYAGDAGDSTTSADGGPGGGLLLWGETSIEGSTIDHNTAGSGPTSPGSTGDGGAGGGIYSGGSGTMTLLNATISDNTSGAAGMGGYAGRGGGIYMVKPATIRFSTIYYNVIGDDPTTTYGGGIYIASWATLTLGSSILASNVADWGPDCFYTQGTVQSEDYFLMEVSSGCPITSGPTTHALMDLSFSLPSLVDNGGPTETRALLAGYVAIDAGNPAAYPARDQRGYFRPVNGAPDMGAFEYASFPLDLFSWLPLLIK